MGRSFQPNWSVYVCTGGVDLWLAQQLAARINEKGAVAFLDEDDALEVDPESRILSALDVANEIVILIGEDSLDLGNVRLAVGAAILNELPICGLLCGLDEADSRLERFKTIGAVVQFSDSNVYLTQLGERVRGGKGGRIGKASMSRSSRPSGMRRQDVPPNKFDVFLCYNTQDREEVTKLSDDLKNMSLTPWLDVEQIRPGDAWQDVLEEQLEDIKAATVLIGQGGIGPWQDKEIKAFLREFVKRNCRVIPVLLRSAPKKPRLPILLEEMMWVDFRKEDPDPLSQLAWGITGFRDYRDKERDPKGPVPSPRTVRERQKGMPSSVDFVLVTALDEERDALLDLLPKARQLPPSADDVRVYFASDLPATFPDGSRSNYSLVVLSLLNMGRVEAAIATSDAVRKWRPNNVLLVGIAGGFSRRGVRLGDVLISDQVVDYELQKVTTEGPEVRYQVHRADPTLLAFAKSYRSDAWPEAIRAKRPRKGLPQSHVGPIATGDKVDAFNEVLRKYGDAWPKLIGVEMEAGGVASTCFQTKTRPGFFMVRAVSDLADKEKDSSRVARWRPYACQAAAAYTVALLQAGPVQPISKSR